MSRMGSEISRLRKEAGMTQGQLAKAVGVTESYIADVEAGKKVLNGSLAARISKALKKEADSLELYNEAEIARKPEPDRKVAKVIEKPVQAIWDEALSGVLKEVPIYNYNMDKAVGRRQMPVIGNRIEGYPKDKTVFLKIENNEMAGFRIMKEDLAMACLTGEIERDGTYLVEYAGRRIVRQIRTIEGGKLLLVGNMGGISTETVYRKDVKVLARLVRLEVEL